ncbi:amino acid synthesis family protein [Streptomyces sp. NPDC047000]|uniref:amino acid synthesis family protein n=1 Tax=Streptomyces sp. NPDC047000 TaxID=3155474 RepID=UPI0033E9C657
MTGEHRADTAPAPLRHSDPASADHRWGLRKIVVRADEMLTEAGAVLPEPVMRVTAAAVIRNPWIGLPTDNDLRTPVREIAARLARLLTDRVLAQCGGPDRIEAFGKGALIGTSGELEHGAALLHTPYFAGLVRTFLGGDQVIAFADDRADAGIPLVIPLCRKDAGPTRDHFQTVPTCVPDAPRPDEILVAVGASTGTRPFARAGDRTTDPVVRADDLRGDYS